MTRAEFKAGRVRELELRRASENEGLIRAELASNLCRYMDSTELAALLEEKRAIGKLACTKIEYQFI